MALSKAQKQQVIEMLLNGENPNDFIKQCGIKNPTCTVWNLKNYLKKYDPETWKKILPKTETPETVPAPISGGKWEKMETPEGSLADAMAGMKDAADEFFGKCEDMGLKTITDDDVEAKLPEEPEFEYTVSAIRTEEFGEFYYDRKFNCIDWRTVEGDEVSLHPQGWKNLVEQMPKILKVLGVEL